MAPLESDIMEVCRRYADAANGKEFTYSMAGPVCPRDARPVRLHHLIDLAKNKYGEGVIRLVGVAAGSAVKRTRLDGWGLRRKATDKPAESAEEVLSERSEVPLSGDSCAPCSSGNNCTSPTTTNNDSVGLTDIQCKIRNVLESKCLFDKKVIKEMWKNIGVSWVMKNY